MVGTTLIGGRRALVVRGGWAGHDPTETTDRIIPMLREHGFSVTVSESLESYADRELMKNLSLIVQCWTMGTISDVEQSGLLAAVRDGTGIAGWHGGLCDAFREAPDYQFMTGGQWVAHPGGKLEYEVRFCRERASDPVIVGFEDFYMTSEQYYMHVDPSNVVLATTTFRGTEDAPWAQGCTMPVVWKRTYGRGRVFYSALGHDAGDFDLPQVQELVLRGSLWAARPAYGDDSGKGLQ